MPDKSKVKVLAVGKAHVRQDGSPRGSDGGELYFAVDDAGHRTAIDQAEFERLKREEGAEEMVLDNAPIVRAGAASS